MPIIKGEAEESEWVIQAAKLMLISARTAPKAGGEDDISTALLYGEEKESLASEMDRLASERKGGGFFRAAKNLRDSDAVLLVGVKGREKYRHRIGGQIDCGACGYTTCAQFEKAEKKMGNDFVGPLCMMKILDLGIALGSVAKMASSFNVDNRLFYTLGVGAVKLKLLPEADVVIGIPLSAKGKNIYFDRTS